VTRRGATDLKTITECRACEGTDLQSVLNLGKQPLANRFLTDAQLDEPEPTYPLHLVRCLTCGLCQLDTVVDPEILYGPQYPYRSGYSEGWRKHCGGLAAEIAQMPKRLTLDIGCLDGTLLKKLFGQGIGAVGCDPSGVGHPAVSLKREFFGRDTRFAIGKFDVIVAQNVFGHVDDAKGFLEGVAANLAPNGQAIIECPSAVDMVCAGRWDTIYHEHLSYWTSKSVAPLVRRAGLRVEKVAYFPEIHGGTVRYYLRHGSSGEFEIAEGAWGQVFEANKLSADDYGRFAIRAYGDMKRWDKYLQNPQRKSIAAYGASAKLSTFLNALPNRPSIVGVFDDNPTKWNLYTPGWHFPVLKPTAVTIRETEVLLVGASNWKAEIETKAQALGFTGEIVSLW
jgi:SAM-dependent methyltransferase